MADDGFVFLKKIVFNKSPGKTKKKKKEDQGVEVVEYLCLEFVINECSQL